jgi:polysaccharide pyruvyl transferase WcaK-like protein
MFREWPRMRSGVVGLAMVDFTDTLPEPQQGSEILANGYASLADYVVKRTGKDVALICMEQADEVLAGQVHQRMAHMESARLFSARHYDASQMTSLIRGLDLLVTSRYHAAMISLAAGVPQVAVGHDTRLAALYRDLGLNQRWFMEPCLKDNTVWDVCAPEFFAGLKDRVDMLLKNPVLQKYLIVRGYRARLDSRHLADPVSYNFSKTGNCGYPADADCKEGAAWAA